MMLKMLTFVFSYNASCFGSALSCGEGFGKSAWLRAVFVLPGVSCRVGAERSIRIVPAVVLLCMSKMAEKPECAIDTVRDYS